MRQLMLAEHTEHIGLILCAIIGSRKQKSSVFLENSGVVPRSNSDITERKRPVQKNAEFHRSVAHHAGIRCAARLIRFHKRDDHIFKKFLPQIKQIKRNTDLLRRTACVFRLTLAPVTQEHRSAADLVALPLQ